METLKINKKGMLVLPKDLISIFKPSDEIVCFANGDTLILKKVTPPILSEIPERAKEKTMPLKEIVREIHSYRKGKRSK